MSQRELSQPYCAAYDTRCFEVQLIHCATCANIRLKPSDLPTWPTRLSLFGHNRFSLFFPTHINCRTVYISNFISYAYGASAFGITMPPTTPLYVWVHVGIVSFGKMPIARRRQAVTQLFSQILQLANYGLYDVAVLLRHTGGCLTLAFMVRRIKGLKMILMF